jgi:hypothetical protein
LIVARGFGEVNGWPFSGLDTTSVAAKRLAAKRGASGSSPAIDFSSASGSPNTQSNPMAGSFADFGAFGGSSALAASSSFGGASSSFDDFDPFAGSNAAQDANTDGFAGGPISAAVTSGGVKV